MGLLVFSVHCHHDSNTLDISVLHWNNYIWPMSYIVLIFFRAWNIGFRCGAKPGFAACRIIIYHDFLPKPRRGSHVKCKQRSCVPLSCFCEIRLAFIMNGSVLWPRIVMVLRLMTSQLCPTVTSRLLARPMYVMELLPSWWLMSLTYYGLLFNHH